VLAEVQKGDLYLSYSTFVHCLLERGYEIDIHNKHRIVLWLPDGRPYFFPVYLDASQADYGYVYTNYADLQEIFNDDPKLLHTLMNECTQPIKRTPHRGGLLYDGVMYHYAFEFKISSNGIDDTTNKIFNVVTSDYNENTRDFSGLCLENGHKVISIEKRPFDAFFEIVRRIVDGIISIEEIYKKEHPGKTPTPLMKVKDKDFLNNFELYKKSKESLDYNGKLYEKLRPYLERPGIIPEKIPQETQLDFIYYPIVLLSFPLICSNVPNIDWVSSFIINKGGFRFYERAASSK